jgi:pimeloyl-ACP methyl ester carboxylesterase
VLDWADEQNELQQFFAVPSPALGQPPQYVLMGHSRGAKISALVAAGGGDPSQAASRGFQGQLATGAAHTSGQGSASAVGQQAIESISMDDSGDGSSSGRDSSRQSRSSRVAGLILIDPADSSYEQVEGPR